jgi:hypothetical protein
MHEDTHRTAGLGRLPNGLMVRETDLGLEVTAPDGSGRLLADVGRGPGQFLPTEEQERTLVRSFRGPLGKALSQAVAAMRQP